MRGDIPDPLGKAHKDVLNCQLLLWDFAEQRPKVVWHE